jgi:hypothetical protein
MIRNTALTLICLLAAAGCKKSEGTPSQLDFAAQVNKAVPQSARCSQTSTIESVTVHERLVLKITDSFLSGTYNFATGERDSIKDTGFQNLSGLISGSESKDGQITLTLEKGSLSVFFDDDFAPEKKLKEVRFQLKDKKVSFLIEGDSRETVLSGCTFE